jgi:hypothetical protein
MKTVKFLCAGLVLLLWTSGLYAGSGVGGQAGAFLRLGVGARAIGLGEAYTAIADDASGIYWNPAGIGRMTSGQFQAMYSIMSFDRRHLFGGSVQPVGEAFTVGFGVINFGVENIDGRDAVGNPTGTFEDSETAFMLAVSKKVGFFSFGVTGKYLHHTLFQNSANGFSFDAGILLQFLDAVSIGVVAQDVGGQLKWNTASSLKETLPISYRGGLSISPNSIPITLAVDATKVQQEKTVQVNSGLEVRLARYFGVRGGYNNDKQYAFGGFVRIPSSSVNLQFDYAANSEVLGSQLLHTVGFSMEF